MTQHEFEQQLILAYARQGVLSPMDLAVRIAAEHEKRRPKPQISAITNGSPYGTGLRSGLF